MGKASLKSFAHAQAECVTVFASGDICAKIDVILLAQLEPHSGAAAGKKVVVPEQQLIFSRDCLADAAECNDT